jgi:phage head maturation protease
VFSIENIKTKKPNRMIWGYATTDSLDKQGEVLSEKAIRNALPDYKKWRNVREMHQQKTVGSAVHLLMIPGKGLLVGIKITDEKCWEKIQSGLYRGLSIGGIIQNKEKRFFGGRMITVITELTIAEISVVDQPANNETTLLIKPEEKKKEEEIELFEKWFNKVVVAEEKKGEEDNVPEELLATLLDKLAEIKTTENGTLEVLEDINKKLVSLEERISRIEKRFTTKKSVEGQTGSSKKRKWESVLRLIS